MLQYNRFDMQRRYALVAFALATLLALIIIPVFAGPVTFLQDTAKKWLDDMLTGTLNDNVLSVFSQVPAAGADTSSAWAVAERINTTVVRPVGFALIGLCFTIKVARVATDFEHITPERFLSPFAQMAGCSFLMGHSLEIMQALINFGVSLAIQVQNAAIGLLGQDVTSLTSQMMPQFDDSHGIIVGYMGELWESAGLVAQLLIPHIAFIVVTFVMKIVSYGVIIELIVRAALFPMFGGDIMLHGFEGSGMRFFKSFLAVCAQGAVIVLIAAIQNAMNYSALQQFLASPGGGLTEAATIVKGIGKVIIFDFAGVALMLKASQITREALGA